MTRFADPNIPRKGKVLQDHRERRPSITSEVPTFSLVEFNLTELCNRKCVFCPRVDPEVYPNRNLSMEPSLFEKIMTDLHDLGYTGRILFSAFSEPLLLKELEEFLRTAKRLVPDAGVEIVTNGDFVTPEKVRSLFEAGLSTLLISMYDGPHQQPHFEEIVRKSGVDPARVILRVRYLPPEESYGINLSNRAGMITLPQIGVTIPDQPIAKPCFYPHYQFLIDFDGTVLLCPHDWGKKLKAGDLKRQSILEVWNGKAMNFARRRLGQSKRDFAPCNRCDVAGTLMGREHFEAWERHYREEDAREG